jgi:hypothetical protein
MHTTRRPALAGFDPDHVRQTANLLLAVGQAASAFFAFSSLFASGAEVSQRLFNDPSRVVAQILPADYAFTIWGLIFSSSIAYGIYQALPAQRQNSLLRRIGWYTALTFLAVLLWSPAAVVTGPFLTTPLFFLGLFGLITSLYRIHAGGQPLTRAQNWLVLGPLSIFAGYATVGCIANTAAIFVELGQVDLWPGAVIWSVLLLIAAAAITGFVTWFNHGNLAYAAVVTWAAVGIIVGSLERNQSLIVTLTAILPIVAVWAVFAWARQRDMRKASIA